MSALPGEDWVRAGIADLGAGRRTEAALLVAIGSPRLRASGLQVPSVDVTDPEARLYEMLASRDADSAHSRYNALIRRLVSFERALECGGR